MKSSDQIPGLLWVGLGIFFSVGGIRYGLGTLHHPGPGFFPALSGALFSLIGLILIFTKTPRASNGKTDKSTDGPKMAEKGSWKSFLPLFFVTLILFGYACTFEDLGFLFSTFLFLFFLLKVSEPRDWLIPLLFSLSTVILSHLVFAVWLGCQLPLGIIKDLF